MALPLLDYKPQAAGESEWANAHGWMDQGRRRAMQMELDSAGFADQVKAQEMQRRNDLIRQQFANSQLSNYGEQMGFAQPYSQMPQDNPGMVMQGQDFQSQSMSPQEMPGAQPMSPSMAQRNMATKGTKENPYSPREYQMMRQAMGDTSTVHWQKDSDGKLYGVSGLGIVETGIQADPLEMNLKKYDAKRIAAYDDLVDSAERTRTNLDSIASIISSEVFKDVRSVDLLGTQEFDWYKKFGTLEQKEQIAELETYMNNIIKNSSKDFKGSFRAGEQRLLESMKPTSRDTLSAMKGKVEALSFLNDMVSERAQIESYYMRELGYSYLDAKKMADEEIDPELIKSRIYDALNPDKRLVGGYSMTDLEYTAKAEGITVEQLMEQLGM